MRLAFELNAASKGAKRRLRMAVFERAVSRALSYQRAACMAMPTKTSATITIKAATMMSIVIALQRLNVAINPLMEEEDAKSQGYHNKQQPPKNN